MGKANVTIWIYDDVSTQLPAIALNTPPRSPFENQLRIPLPYIQPPGAEQRIFKAVRAVGFTFGVEQEGERRVGFIQPDTRLVGPAE